MSFLRRIVFATRLYDHFTTNPPRSLQLVRNKSYNVSSNDEFMEKVLNSQTPVIVNFHAEWCDPCHILTPKLKELTDNSEEVDLAIIDVEENPELVHTFEVKAVPAIIAIRNGLVVDKFIGLIDAAKIEGLMTRLKGNKQE
ncbi:thioredoxin, mitochondrial [Rhodnius prolixus]|uniref:Putative thioredoxin-like protein rhodnius neglectus n=2 Tax=Rhodnius TaxID=13248 RepID=A0A4P6D7W3_RHOPR